MSNTIKDFLLEEKAFKLLKFSVDDVEKYTFQSPTITFHKNVFEFLAEYFKRERLIVISPEFPFNLPLKVKTKSNKTVQEIHVNVLSRLYLKVKKEKKGFSHKYITHSFCNLEIRHFKQS